MSRRTAAALICLAMTVMITAALPAVSFADEKKDKDFYSGYRQIEKKVHKVSSGPKLRAQDLPVPTESYYNSASQSWYWGVSRIKDQDNTGLCWAFASTSAAEISYAKEYYETTNNKFNSLLSPAHMGYFLYNRVNDPLGNTQYDSNEPVGSDWAMIGGQALLAMLHMSTWSGPGLESSTPFSSVVNSIKTRYDAYGNTVYYMAKSFSLADSLAYNDYLTLENSIYYPELNKNTMKSLIYKYGAVDAALYMDENYFPGGDAIEEEAYYNPDAIAEYGTNHAVTVVGWDDSYSKDNFRSYSYYYGGYRQPKMNGAWIVQNSYGTDFHDGGYFYVSYESCGLTDSPVVAYDMQPADTYDYNYQYDGSVNTADTTESGLPVIYSKSRAANVFTAQDDIVLRAVGITEYDEGTTDYTVSIYTGLTNAGDPMSGKCVSMTTYSTDTPGCKTIPLTDPVAIDEGEKYSIVIMFNTAGTAFGAEKLEKDDDLNRSWLKIYVDTEPGQSFYRAKESSKWVDMSTAYGACFRIKGFADDPEVYNVTFTDGMGNTLGTERVKELRAAEGAYTPYREGYRFTGWDKDISSVTGNMTVNAQWAKLYSIDPVFTGYGTVAAPAGGAVPSELVTVNMAGETGYWPDVNSIHVCNDTTGEFIPFKVSYSLTEDEQYYEILDRTNVKVRFVMPEGGVSIYASFVERPANTMTAKGKTVKVKYSALKKKAVSIKRSKAITVTKAAGKASYKLLSVKKPKFKKYFKINSKTGTITVKKGLRKGSYKLSVKVSDPGSALYYPKTKKAIVTVKVK